MITEDHYRKIWHSGDEKPQMYTDELTGHKLNTYCICVYWYDGWNETMCKVTEDGNFIDIEDKNPYEPGFFSYWCYSYDIYPRETTEEYLVDISVQEGH